VHSNWSSSRTLAEVHATSMKRLSKIETADDPADVVKIEGGYEIE
jgi:hypothetical protein